MSKPLTSTEQATLVERLRQPTWVHVWGEDNPRLDWEDTVTDLKAAADLITALREENERIKQEATFLSDDVLELRRERSSQRAQLAALQAQIAVKDEALDWIAAQCPTNDPGPAYDPGYGYRSEGNQDDVARDVCDEELWPIGQRARAARAGRTE